MSRTILLAAAVTASTALPASSDDALFRWKWEGVIRILSQSEQCYGRFDTAENIRAIYQPNLVGVDDRKTSLMLFRKTDAEMIRNDDEYGQFSGDGYYNRYTLGNGAVTKSYAYYGSQPFSFVQTPATVTAATAFVTLSGKLYDYGDTEDCDVTVRGTFVGVDTEEGPPPPPYGGGGG